MRPSGTVPNVPVAYIHHHSYQSHTTIDMFTYFQDIMPDGVFFEIPATCQLARQTSRVVAGSVIQENLTTSFNDEKTEPKEVLVHHGTYLTRIAVVAFVQVSILHS